ncbi:unnamed protein product [marine sediment metagenome]|uniref:Uncharacterized protein n=1 Tax=marine sediment metagenome TaxID=412755 RepID=X0TR93_9ZZZZ
MGRLTEALGGRGGGLDVRMRIKVLFMDTACVKAAVDKVRRRNLSRIGYWIMKSARWSLLPARRKTLGQMYPKERRQYESAVRSARMHGRRKPKRPWASSRPGHPPRVRPRSLLKRRLYFSWDPATASVVIGPEKFRAAGVPHALEHGSTMPTSRRIEKLTGLSSYNMEPRRFMGPALKRARPKMAKKWRDSVRGGL